MQEANEKEMDFLGLWMNSERYFSYCHSRYPFGLYSFSE